MHNLPSSPFPSAEPEQPPKSHAELINEQHALIELSSSQAFRWFLQNCVKKRRQDAEIEALDTAATDEATAKNKFLRAELLKMETWVEDRKAANQQAISELDLDQKHR